MRSLYFGILTAVFWVLAGTYSEISWRTVRPCIPEIGRRDIEPTLGQGVLLGILGGMRTVIADGTWVRSYVLWERKDRPGCETLMRTACALDPRSRYFWENTGYVMGYDMAHWEVRRRGGYAKVPADVQEHLYRSYARRALEVLDQGVVNTGGNAALLIAAGQLAEMKLKDQLLSARYYRSATESRNAPWYAPYFCARNLWEAGQREESYRWYRKIWEEKLSKSEDGAPDDLKNLREMEQALHLPIIQRIPRPAWEK